MKTALNHSQVLSCGLTGHQLHTFITYCLMNLHILLISHTVFTYYIVGKYVYLEAGIVKCCLQRLLLCVCRA